MGILEELGKRILFFDGGTGSLLQERGLKPGELPETWNLLKPEVVTELHRNYLEAGSDVVLTNTFGANRLKYDGEKNPDVRRVVEAAVKNARAAVDSYEKETGRRGYVALDMGPTGKLLKPMGDLDFEDACALFGEVAETGTRAGADCILIETMSDGYEVKAAVLGAKEHSHLPVFVTMTFDEEGKLLTGGNAASAVALLEGLGVDALGINCGLGPVQMKGIVGQILAEASIPVLVKPNAGLPRSENGRTVYDIDADAFAREMEEMASMGVWMMGGCCGTTPEHIRKTVERCRAIVPKPIEEKQRTVISSWSHAVEIGDDPIIVGERINPTGKSRMKQALRENDLTYILEEGVSQQEKGAHVLDVNVGLPEIDEPAMMERAVRELQSVLDLPLQIDTSDMEAMERALRIYNGKPLINSVNGKRESMEAVFPLVKKYGGVVVALALDESGIPETAEGRLEVARKICDTAASYGIARKNILIDALCLTVSSDSRGAAVALETLRRVRQELGCRTTLGVSNISFGLPKRGVINSVFFAMALQSGLSAAIINPGAEGMMNAYCSYRALMGLDPQCGAYIERYGGQEAERRGGTAPAGASFGGTAPGGTSSGTVSGGNGLGAAMSLGECVEKGLREQAAAVTRELLAVRDPLDIIQEEMIPALDRAGVRFEAGTLYLPQLLMCAEAAKAAFELIKERMLSCGEVQEKKGTIILATVKGDIHDIGKNIVKVLLENYSYDVIDLGKDVPPEKVAETAVREKVRLVGLSALMTTTVPSMEETIRLLHREAPGTKVMVGGAVLTEDYAKTIGADCYCRDGMASVKYAESVFGAGGQSR